MIRPDIIIVSNKPELMLSPFRAELDGYCLGLRIITTCQDASAAVNRNYGLERARSEVVIQVDDDIRGFYPGWWKRLIKPLEAGDVSMVSARLLQKDGSPGPMMFGNQPDTGVDVESVPAVPTACCAHLNDGIRFDERFIKSGYEDTMFCQEVRHRYFDRTIVINNKCTIVHLHEAQGQAETEAYNRAVYQKALQEKGWSDL